MNGNLDDISSVLDIPREEMYFTRAYLELGLLSEDSPIFSLGSPRESVPEVYDLASLTKGLVTSPIIFSLATQGEIGFGDTIGTYINDFPPLVADKTIRELLAHRSGLPAWRNFWINYLSSNLKTNEARLNSESIIKKVFNRADLTPNETEEVYSDLGFILLGLVIEKICQKPLDQVFQDFLKSIGLKNELFGYPPFATRSQVRFVPTSYCEIRERTLEGEVHDENCAALGGIAGHAGLFGSGPVLGEYLRVLSRSAIGSTFFEANHQASKNNSPMLGLRKGDDPSSQPFGQGKGIGHLGFTGTAFWVDWERGSYGIYLTNRISSSRISPRIKHLRKDAFQYLQAKLDSCQKNE